VFEAKKLVEHVSKRIGKHAILVRKEVENKREELEKMEKEKVRRKPRKTPLVESIVSFGEEELATQWLKITKGDLQLKFKTML